MSYYYFTSVKGDLSNARERGLLDINCRKTGTGESLTGLAEYNYVFIVYTFILTGMNHYSTQFLLSLNEFGKWNFSRIHPHHIDAWIIVRMFD